MSEGVSLPGVFAAALANMVVAAVWYAPPVLGRAWMGAVGQPEEALRSAAGRGYLVAGIASLVAAFTLASSYAAFELEGPVAGLLLGLEYGMGIAAMYVLSIMAFEARPMKLAWIDAGYVTAGLAAMGAVIGAL